MGVVMDRHRARVSWRLSIERALWAWNEHGIYCPISGDDRPAVPSTMREEPAEAGGQP